MVERRPISFWNIADAVFGGDMLPLEQDSIDILTLLAWSIKVS
jgi:hypothetical protein